MWGLCAALALHWQAERLLAILGRASKPRITPAAGECSPSEARRRMELADMVLPCHLESRMFANTCSTYSHLCSSEHVVASIH